MILKKIFITSEKYAIIKVAEFSKLPLLFKFNRIYYYGDIMIIKELLDKCDLESVLKILEFQYNIEYPKIFGDFLNKLKKYEFTKNENSDTIRVVTAFNFDEITFFASVYNDSEPNTRYSLGALTYNEFLNLKIIDENLKSHQDEIFLAVSIWEFTFYGFDDYKDFSYLED